MTSTGPNQTIVPLSKERCLELLATESVGRVGFVSAEGVEIFPLSYRLGVGPRLFIGTQAWGIIGQLAESGVVCSFEVDHYDTTERQGWSVLMRGVLSRLDPTGAAAYAELASPVEPWPGYRDAKPVQFLPQSFKGRSVPPRP